MSGKLTSAIKKLVPTNKKNALVRQKTEESEEFQFKHSQDIIMRRGVFKGYTGFVKHINLGLYQVKVEGVKDLKDPIQMSENLFKYTGDFPVIGQSVMLKGQYKGKTGKIIRVLVPPRLRIHLDATGKTIFNHSVKEGATFITKGITPDDVFFKDFMVNGKTFQAVNVYKDNKITGIQMDDIEKKIQKFNLGDVMLNRGFEKQGVEKIAEEIEMESDIGEMLAVEDTERDEEEDEEEETVGPTFMEDDDQKISYKQMEQMYIEQEPLSVEETDYKTKINQILKEYDLQNDIDIFQLAKGIGGYVKGLKKKDWKKSDTKYIVAAAVFDNIVKIGGKYKLGSVDSYIGKLETSKFFNRNDINDSIFLEDAERKELEGLVKSKQYTPIYKRMFERAMNRLDLVIPIKMTDDKMELIPLGKKFSRKKQEPVKVISATSLIEDKDIPESVERIIWKPEFEDIINLTKKKIQEFLNQNKETLSKTASEIYTYIVSNLERAPLAIREIERAPTSKYNTMLVEKFKDIYKVTFDEIKRKNEELSVKKETVKQKRKRDIEQLQARRETIETGKKLKGLELTDD